VRATPVNILLVDDQPAKLLSYEVILSDLQENLITASSASEALAVLLKTDVAVVLVDVCMPDLDGFELVQMIREHPRFQDIAVIFISAVLLTDLDRIKGYEFGAVDYVPVPVVPQILRAKVKIFVELYRKARELEAIAATLEQRVAERTAELEASSSRLRKSDEQLRQALTAAKMGTWRHDLTAQVSQRDENLNAILGLQPLESIGPTRAWLDRIHEDDLELVTDAWQKAIKERGAYEAEMRIHHNDGTVRWLREQGHYVPDPNGLPGSLTGLTVDITERKQAEEARSLLIEELNHRVKNMLATVQSIAHQSLSGAQSEQKQRFLSRIQALATGHNLLTQSRWKGARLNDILDALFAPYRAETDARLTLRGDDVVLSSRDAISVTLAIHELLTNAVKYGAYTVPSGRIDVAWTIAKAPPSKRLQFEWDERGGPPAIEPETTGFGTRLLKSLAAQPSGEYSCHYRDIGVLCQFTLPIEGQV
jgi:PAS domain S-box-containing protein